MKRSERTNKVASPRLTRKITIHTTEEKYEYVMHAMVERMCDYMAAGVLEGNDWKMTTNGKEEREEREEGR